MAIAIAIGVGIALDSSLDSDTETDCENNSDSDHRRTLRNPLHTGWPRFAPISHPRAAFGEHFRASMMMS
jgi:hypothetical protein